MSNFTVLQSFEEFEKFVGQPGDKIVTFSTTWCQPCKRFRPHFEKVAETAPIPMAYIYIDELPDGPQISQRYGIASVPDVRLIKPPVASSGYVLNGRTAIALSKELENYGYSV